MDNTWVAFDLDGTLAHYDGWDGIENIGEPIAPMIELLKEFLANDHVVKIFTARIAHPGADQYIKDWCIKHIGQELEITNVKDFGMTMLFDDRAHGVITNTGTTYTFLYAQALERIKELEAILAAQRGADIDVQTFEDLH